MSAQLTTNGLTQWAHAAHPTQWNTGVVSWYWGRYAGVNTNCGVLLGYVNYFDISSGNGTSWDYYHYIWNCS